MVCQHSSIVGIQCSLPCPQIFSQYRSPTEKNCEMTARQLVLFVYKQDLRRISKAHAQVIYVAATMYSLYVSHLTFPTGLSSS